MDNKRQEAKRMKDEKAKKKERYDKNNSQEAKLEQEEKRSYPVLFTSLSH